VAYDAPLDLDLDAIVRDFETIEDSIEHYIASSKAISQFLYPHNRDVTILPGGFFIPVVWRTQKRRMHHHYSSPLSVLFDHISKELGDEICARQLKGFLLFDLVTELVGEAGQVVSRWHAPQKLIHEL